ncbi:17925_t:CDS:2, partial [Dentiscutata erythropus]
RNTSTKTLEEYAMENAQLKSVIDNLTKRMMTYEKAAEENSMLKSSILQFKNDLQKQAKRIKVSQEMLRSSYVAKQVSPESSTVASAQSLQKRIKELEEELQLTKAECEKQKSLAAKYKDRLNKIKDNARSKRQGGQQNESKSNDSSALPDNLIDLVEQKDKEKFEVLQKKEEEKLDLVRTLEAEKLALVQQLIELKEKERESS